MSQATTVTVGERTVNIEVTQPKPLGVTFESRIADFKANGTTNQRTVINVLEDYISKMAPGIAINFDEGSRNQYNLWKALEAVLVRYPREEFQTLWNIILLYFQKYGDANSVLGARYVFRFAPSWQHSEVDLENFHKTINLIHLTADPNKRAKGLKQVSFRIMFGGQYPQEAAQRLTTYYGA